jgi:predicted ester cyclase
MSPAELKSKYQRLYEQVHNNRDLSVIEEFIAPDYKMHDTQPLIEGPDGYRQMVVGFLAAFPDLRFTVKDFIVEGDKVAIYWSFRGTPQGEDRQYTGKGITLLRVNAEGKAVDDWFVTNPPTPA